MVSSGAYRSTKVSWKWSRKLLQRLVVMSVYEVGFTLTYPLSVYVLSTMRNGLFLCKKSCFFIVPAKCAHGLPPCAQIPHRLPAHHLDPVLSQHQSSTYSSRKQPEHPHPQVKDPGSLVSDFILRY